MSDFISEGNFPGLWNEVLSKHWTYFESEESIIKLENREKLEECLKEFLCEVHHDMKFFLAETASVLKNSIRKLENFSAQKAMTAFESISQYSNNLFAKPWRKEFRILKMYSGFYQHEIKSNLLDAEVLFEAMGYRRLSEDTLVLDGPICPDQVTNVSRDAMTAYVELQIIKRIYTGLDAIGINCSWFDIYCYREKNTGGPSKAIEHFAYYLDEKSYRSKQEPLICSNYNYIDVQRPSNYFSTIRRRCPAQCQSNFYHQAPLLSNQRVISRPNDICCIPEHQQPSLKTNLSYSNINYPTQHYLSQNHNMRFAGVPNETGTLLFPQISHSRSLEHYSERGNHNSMLPHRHSFDHQQHGCAVHVQCHNSQLSQYQHFYQHLIHPNKNFYEPPYDSIGGNSLGGGSSNISYDAVAANSGSGKQVIDGSFDANIHYNLKSNSTYSHPYNVSGNRFPLPINISNEMCAHDNLSPCNYNAPQEPTYDFISEPHTYSSVSKLSQNSLKNNNIGNNIHATFNDLIQMQRSCQSEQLINFEEPNMLSPATSQKKLDSQIKCCQHFEVGNHSMAKHNNLHNIIVNLQPIPAIPTREQHCGFGTSPKTNDVYAKPNPKESRAQNVQRLREYQYNSGERGDITDVNYESGNDDFCNLANGVARNERITPTQSKKNQDGVGLSEDWNFVYQKLEKHDCSKEFLERSDLLVQSLDLNTLNINSDASASQRSSAEKKFYHSGNENKGESHCQLVESKQKSKSNDIARNLSKNNVKMENSVSTTSINNIQIDNSTRKMKSAPPQTNSTSKQSTNSNKSQPKPNDNNTLSKRKNNNNKDPKNSGNGTMLRKKSNTSVVSMTKKSPSGTFASAPPPPLTQNIANEWSCTFCTFLNPETKHICEMCCHTKGFNLDSSITSTAAGGTSLAQNTTTCA